MSYLGQMLPIWCDTAHPLILHVCWVSNGSLGRMICHCQSDTWIIWFFCILMKILTWKTYGHFDVLLNCSIFRPFFFPIHQWEQGTKMRIWWSLMSHLQVPGCVHHMHWSVWNLLLAKNEGKRIILSYFNIPYISCEFEDVCSRGD